MTQHEGVCVSRQVTSLGEWLPGNTKPRVLRHSSLIVRGGFYFLHDQQWCELTAGPGLFISFRPANRPAPQCHVGSESEAQLLHVTWRHKSLHVIGGTDVNKEVPANQKRCLPHFRVAADYDEWKSFVTPGAHLARLSWKKCEVFTSLNFFYNSCELMRVSNDFHSSLHL